MMTNQPLKFIICLLILTCLGITSCKKSQLEDLKENPSIEDLVVATIYGKVIDESGNPIINGEVIYKSGVELFLVKTDEEGYFLFKDVQNKGNTAYLSVTSPKKFEAFRRLSLVENRNNYTEIKMMDRKTIGSIEAVNGGVLAQEDGAKIALPANAVVTNDGQLYDGKVVVVMAWIDPSGGDLAQRMVGDLSGIDEAGNLKSLSTMGMLQIELIGEDGSLLNLKEGALATLTFPIPPSLLPKAAPTIPLWSYNETNGIWTKEGEATLEGATYVGEVSHFSSWNVDYEFDDPIEITGQVKWSLPTQANQARIINASNLQIYLCSEEIGKKGGWLCEDGAFRFYNFPKGEKFDLKVLDLCGNTIFQETYGPFSTSTDLRELLIDDSSNSMVSLKGKAVNCMDEPVTNGYIHVTHGSNISRYPLAEDGTFELGYLRCELDDIVLKAIDNDAIQTSRKLAFDPGDPIPAFLDIRVCNDLDNFISVEIVGLDDILFIEENCYLTPEVANDSLAGIHSLTFDNQAANSLSTFDALFTIPKNFETDPNFNMEKVRLLDFFVTDGTVSCFKLPLKDITASFTNLDITPGNKIEGIFRGRVGCTSPEGTIETQISGAFSVRVK